MVSVSSLAISDGAPDEPPAHTPAPLPQKPPRKSAHAHHLGHRERLRERAAKGGFVALPDYELIELFLFRTFPRGDVKPLAKAACRHEKDKAEQAGQETDHDGSRLEGAHAMSSELPRNARGRYLEERKLRRTPAPGFSLGLERDGQEGARLLPLAPHHALGHSQRLGDLAFVEAGEVAQLQHARRTRVGLREPVERVVDRHCLLRALHREPRVLAVREPLPVRARDERRDVEPERVDLVTIEPDRRPGHEDLGRPAWRRLDRLGLPRTHVTRVPGSFTAQAFITTDLDDNQITAFHPGAMVHSHLNTVSQAADVRQPEAVQAALGEGWRRLHFASADEIRAVTGCVQGAVSPIALPDEVPVGRRRRRRSSPGRA